MRKLQLIPVFAIGLPVYFYENLKLRSWPAIILWFAYAIWLPLTYAWALWIWTPSDFLWFVAVAFVCTLNGWLAKGVWVICNGNKWIAGHIHFTARCKTCEKIETSQNIVTTYHNMLKHSIEHQRAAGLM